MNGALDKVGGPAEIGIPTENDTANGRDAANRNETAEEKGKISENKDAEEKGVPGQSQPDDINGTACCFANEFFGTRT